MSLQAIKKIGSAYGHCLAGARQTLACFTQQGKTLATAESCTGGLLGALLTEIPGSSQVYRGGVCAYSVAAKCEFLKISADFIQAHGVVSRQVVLAMARGVRESLQADIGVATTGIAGPAAGDEPQAVGTVWCGFAGAHEEKAILLQLTGGRSEIRFASVENVLAELRQFIINF